MSKVIDERVVEMRFDNKQFEKNTKESLTTLEKLKKSLNFKGATKGLEEISKASKNTNISGIGTAVDAVKVKFSALEVMAVTALANIANSAVNAGKRMINSLTIDPVKTGFQEYELKMGSIQTIMAGTGESLETVNKYLDELNTYADRTIYSFADMTSNIGKFTNSGVKLKDAVKAIQGVSNEAAISGANATQASAAMYNFAQALSAGYVKLIDWKSIENANMATLEFKNQLLETAVSLGTVTKSADGMYTTLSGKTFNATKDFNDCLQEQWMTTDVLVTTLGKYADETTDIGKKAFAAAQDVKTFTQLMDTLKEAAGSGWAETWQIIIGDFDQAKGLWSGVSEILGEIINNSSKARNTLLQGWSDLGGRLALIESFKNLFKGFGDFIKPIKEAFREIFPPITAKQLFDITENFKKLTEHFKISGKTADKIKRTFSGVFSIFSLLGKAMKAIMAPINSLFNSGIIEAFLNSILTITAGIGDFITKINESKNIGDFFSSISSALSSMFNGIGSAIGITTGKLESFSEILSYVGSVVTNVGSKVFDRLSSVFNWIADNISAGDVFAGLAGGSIFVAVKKFSGLIDKIKDSIDGLFGSKSESLKEKFADVLGSLGDTLSSFTSGIKANTLLTIAAAVGVLSMSLSSIAKIEPEGLARSLVAVGAIMTMLNVSFAGVLKSLSKFQSKGLMKASVSLIAISATINIFATALNKIARLKMQQIATGLAGLAGGLAGLVISLKAIEKTKISLSTSIAILAIASASKTLADALKKFSTLSWDEIKRGLISMGIALGELSMSVIVLGKAGGFKSLLGSAGLLMAVQALDEISENLNRLSKLSWNKIQRGLTAMGGALAELVIAISVLSKIGGFKSILSGTALLITVKSLDEISENLKKLGSMTWKKIGKGLTAMGIALGELSISLGVLGKIAGFSGLLASGAILIVSKALKPISETLANISKLSWEEIAKGLTGMGIALAEIGIITGALGSITGLSGILGAGALLLSVQGLGDIADALKKFGKMTWDEIGRGLVGMGGALTELAVITGVLGTVAPLGALVGSGSLLLSVQGLGDIADALKKFGDMSWDEIGRGLAAMGAALGETAIGGLLNTLSGFGAESINTIAGPLGVLADSVKKWTGVTVPDGLGWQLSLLGMGVSAFNFSGWGADAIVSLAKPLGDLSDSVKKWTGIIIPKGLGDQLRSLAPGISAFNFAGWGADAIADVAAPLGTLASSVKKWVDVIVPENMQTMLISLANGVKAFNFAGWAANDIADVSKPLGNLATEISKWSTVELPSNMGEKLKSLANGVKSFNLGIFDGGYDIVDAIDPIGKLAGALEKWNVVTLTSSMGNNLTSFATGIQTFNNTNTSNIDNVIGKMKNIIKIVGDYSTVDFEPIKVVGKNIAETLFTTLSNGIEQGGKTVKEKIKGSLSSMVSSIKGYYLQFAQAGSYLVDGFAAGIRSNSYKGSLAASAMAQAAVNAARRTLDINSPSKVFKGIGKFAGLGFVSALKDYATIAKSAGSDMAQGSIDGLKDTLSNANNAINLDSDMNPTIRPVLDLSNVQRGSSMINDLFTQRTMALATSATVVTSNNANMMNAINEAVKSTVEGLLGSDDDLDDDAVVAQINLQVDVDGKEMAKVTAPLMNKELNKINNRKSRKGGKL